MTSPVDPFELDRLAEDLESRTNIVNDNDNHDLPVFVPLQSNNPHLSDTTSPFNVESFLLSRSQFTSLPDLRSELREYLVTLKQELVKLINDDYEAFISLSTDLRDEGARLDNMARPLAGLKSQILVRRVPFVLLYFHVCVCE